MSQLLDVRDHFPQLKVQVRGKPLVYLDSGATSLKPIRVIEAVTKNLREGSANVHRGAHYLSDMATEQFEEVREKLRQFVGAESRSEIIFTHGTTESLNLLAYTLGRTIINEGDEILLSQMEHHSNIVPWQIMAEERRAIVRFIPVLEDGTLDQVAYEGLLSPRTKIVSLVHISNALGTLNPLREMFLRAKQLGAVCIADAAQSAPTLPLNVQDLACDFLIFSGHKMFAPTGVGVLYGRAEWLDRLPPYQSGGSMIREVREDGVDFLPPPQRFEAGTPPIAEVIGLGAALDFINDIGLNNILAHDKVMVELARHQIGRVPDLRWIGANATQHHALSFLLNGQHPSDVGAILDEQGIAVRTGHHCCQPLMRRFGIPGTVRASFSIYTSEADIEILVRGLRKAQELLS